MHNFSVTQLLTKNTAELMIARAFPGATIENVELLSGGLINTNLKVNLSSKRHPAVLRVYRDGPDVCHRELAIYELIHDRVPVAGFLHAEPDGVEGSSAFALLEFIEGISFQQLKRTGNDKGIKEAARSAGETLAAISSFQFPSPGRLVVEQGQLRVGAPYITGPDPVPRLLDGFLASAKCQLRAGPDLARRIHEFGWSWADRLPDLDDHSSLVHSDFGNRNIVVHEVGGKWRVAAVLDWEFSISGSPLLDVGHFLRYERLNSPVREPHFSEGFLENGGHLPENWREIVRVLDLTGLVECLTHDELPLEVEAELLSLIEATLNELN